MIILLHKMTGNSNLCKTKSVPLVTAATPSSQLILLLSLLLFLGGNLSSYQAIGVDAFLHGSSPVSSSSSRPLITLKHPSTTSTTTICWNSVGNFLSSVTGSSPSQPLLNENDSLTSSLVRGTSLEGKQLQRVYQASSNGWSAIDFHQAVDNKGSGLVVALTKSITGGIVFGGFNPVGWRSTDDYYGSNAAFLWYTTNGNTKGIKCPILQGGNAAIFDYATGGPCFGASDLIIGEPKAAIMGGFAGPDMMDTRVNAGNLKSGNCGGGGAYDLDAKWPVRGKFEIVQLEVYCNAEVVAAAEKEGRGSGGGGPNWWPF